MLTVDLIVPAGVFSHEQRRAIAERLTGRRLLSDMDNDESTDAGVLELLDSVSQVVVREADVWLAGGEPVTASGGPRYIANVVVGMWGKEVGDHVITRITEELAALDGTEPTVVVNVLSVHEGGYGIFGHAQRTPDMLNLIESAKTGGAEPDAGDDVFVDPVCGATVPRADAVILEHDGQTYGFCCPHCRGHFVKTQRAKTATR